MVNILRVLSLLCLTIFFWYIMILPSQRLKLNTNENHNLCCWAELIELIPNGFFKSNDMGQYDLTIKEIFQKNLFNNEESAENRKPNIFVAFTNSDKSSINLLIRSFDETGKKLVYDFNEANTGFPKARNDIVKYLKDGLINIFGDDLIKNFELIEKQPLWYENANYFLSAVSIINPDLPKIDFKGDDKSEQAAKKLAKLELDKKVYPEIQGRLTKINDWLVMKIQFAGALLGAFLIHLWLPILKANNVEEENGKNLKSLNHRQAYAVRVKEDKDLLNHPQICAVLGIACIVSLFMDLEIRESYKMIQQLGSWAGEYAEKVLGGSIQNFPGWEQFIRMPGPENGGLHESLSNAVQTGSLGIMTLVLFAFYHWSFQAVCLNIGRKPIKPEPIDLAAFNRLTYLVFIGALFLFTYSAHTTSGNFEFVDYGHPCWFSNEWSYLFFWLLFSLVLITWDFIGCLKNKPPVLSLPNSRVYITTKIIKPRDRSKNR